MTLQGGFEEVVERYHAMMDHFARGDSGPAKQFFSRQSDVTIANPFGPTVAGREAVERAVDAAAANYRDGRAVRFETIAKLVTPELALLHEVEHLESKIGGRDDIVALSLRVTSVFRPEDGAWKLVHRHADPITTTRSAESIIPG